MFAGLSCLLVINDDDDDDDSLLDLCATKGLVFLFLFGNIPRSFVFDFDILASSIPELFRRLDTNIYTT
jgi:hypothetical protein